MPRYGLAQGDTEGQDQSRQVREQAHHREAEISDIDGGEIETGPARQSHGAGDLRIGVRDGRSGRRRRGVPASMSVTAATPLVRISEFPSHLLTKSRVPCVFQSLGGDSNTQ